MLADGNDTNKHKHFVTSVVTAGFVGLAFVLLKYRRTLFEKFQSVFRYKDSLTLQHIEVINTREQCDDALVRIKTGCSQYRVLGFDCEWVTLNGSRHPVALLQLASHDGFCALFRLCKIRCVPKELKNILEDLTILKVGVAPIDDAKYLLHDYNVNVNGFLDLRHLAVEAAEKPEGLSSLAKTHLNVLLDKNWRIRCSDWEADTLTPKQLDYAATDAHVGVEIFKKLTNKILISKHGLGWSWKALDKKWSDVEAVCENYVNARFKVKKSVSEKKSKFPLNTDADSFKKLISDQQHESLGRADFKQPKRNYHILTRSRPLYQNCYMQKQNGDILCTCDLKKAKWYVEKGLATVFCEDPYTIRLNFKPAGEGVVDVDKYYQMPRENHCVVCGKTHSYIRKNVVPREYRKLFPVVMKTHTSHDVLLLCSGCHQLSNSRDQILRQKLVLLCSAPLDDRNAPKYIKNQQVQTVASAAKALLEASKKHVIPEDRKEKLKQHILSYYGADDLTEEILKDAFKLNFSQENPSYESHGQAVVEHFKAIPGGLLQLEQMWREYFLESMKPKFMPQLWSVTHNKSRLEIRANEGRLDHKNILLAGFTVDNGQSSQESAKEGSAVESGRSSQESLEECAA